MSESVPSALVTLKTALTGANAGILADMLDGPSSAVAIAALGRVLLGDDNAAAADIAAAVKQGGVDLSLQLQQAEQQCLSRLHQADPSWLAAFPVGNVVTQLNVDDTLDARKRQIELHDNTNRVLAYVVTGEFFILILVVTFFSGRFDDSAVKNLLFTLLGVVATGWANIIGFYFGSSAGSQQKSQTIGAALTRSIHQGRPHGKSSPRSGSKLAGRPRVPRIGNGSFPVVHRFALLSRAGLQPPRR
jgi:hypothetical protein